MEDYFYIQCGGSDYSADTITYLNCEKKFKIGCKITIKNEVFKTPSKCHQLKKVKI